MLDGFMGVDETRVYAACATLFAYLLLCWYFLRKTPRSDLRHSGGESTLLIGYASQTGFAEQIAAQTAQSLQHAGTSAQLLSLTSLTAERLAQIKKALFIVSTTGEGDAPDPASPFVRDILAHAVPLPQLNYGVLALGDREYANFCAFGHRLDQWLRHQGASAMFDVVEVDNGDEGALRHWQHHLGLLSGSTDLPDWQPPRYENWRLHERRLLNEGDTDHACYHIALRPGDQAARTWQAGDIAEIGPRNAALDVAALLEAAQLDGNAVVEQDGQREILTDLLARSYLPSADQIAGLTPQAVAAALKPLPHREYSIASIPQDGEIQLLIRQMRRPSGELGVGSGWLTRHATAVDDIAVRIRTNSNFHAPADARPIILIGNGTGIAGLRGLLKQQIASGRYRNWLVFGERHRATDYFYEDEIDAWHRAGQIEILDLVFSRDQAQRRYVQHRLAESGAALRAWIADGASIYVCGSLKGMAPAVDSALRSVLGDATMEHITIDGRYRRDVY